MLASAITCQVLEQSIGSSIKLRVLQQQNASNHEESLSRSIRYQRKTDIANEIGVFQTFGDDRFNTCK